MPQERQHKTRSIDVNIIKQLQMTFNDDVIRVLKAEVETLRNKVQELEAKLEIKNEELNYENR
jgi:hypothetical protein